MLVQGQQSTEADQSGFNSEATSDGSAGACTDPPLKMDFMRICVMPLDSDNTLVDGSQQNLLITIKQTNTVHTYS